ncbi:2'-5' RNA ligase [Halogranum gelatinilyticum]|uniref:2'-5' RNA ligase n=1 Tax=Halogranum gelatinilyticum TaxID=660521 RepID=A0A1G9SPB3_9EURY|nr:2'-5' RNA ligase family protein [Halogranum gelatinilyticum]SDM37299.1 2'-5' RNA ligase [Halogranum gelatinilyticum]
MTDSFAAHWERRHAADPVLQEFDDVRDRGRERPHDYVFLVDIEDETVLDALGAAADALDDLDGVEGASREYLHATVKMLGFVVSDPTGEDEVSRETAARLAAEASDAVDDIDPFELRLPRLNVFPSVVFCEVHDDGVLGAVHDRLLGLDGMPRYRYDGDDYTPHVSLAHFDTEAGFRRAVEWTEANRKVDAGRVIVDAFKLVDIDLREAYPTFETVERYELG